MLHHSFVFTQSTSSRFKYFNSTSLHSRSDFALAIACVGVLQYCRWCYYNFMTISKTPERRDVAEKNVRSDVLKQIIEHKEKQELLVLFDCEINQELKMVSLACS